MDFFISFDGKIKNLILFDYRLFNRISKKIKYLISEKSGITNSINYNVWNSRHDLLMMSINLSDIANNKGSDYRFIISLISINEAIKLMKNADLTEKSRIL